ncbi:uncharacterized protein LOC129971163 [Argiope bruennichi]|uniref:uncharacterized protein LOC129971163 n=1 Tax=Argiope bruennichi TaxID=94029 RepID=UPI002494EDD6|nr:uncharacterized protein LOC129971163 [Argiope bruennichi]
MLYMKLVFSLVQVPDMNQLLFVERLLFSGIFLHHNILPLLNGHTLVEVFWTVTSFYMYRIIAFAVKEDSLVFDITVLDEWGKCFFSYCLQVPVVKDWFLGS